MGNNIGSGTRKIAQIDHDKEAIVSGYIIKYGELLQEAKLDRVTAASMEKRGTFSEPLKSLIKNFEDLIQEAEDKIALWGDSKDKSKTRVPFKSGIEQAKNEILPDLKSKLEEVKKAGALYNLYIYYMKGFPKDRLDKADIALKKAKEDLSEVLTVSREQGVGYSCLKKCVNCLYVAPAIEKEAKKYCAKFDCSSGVEKNIVRNQKFQTLLQDLRSEYSRIKSELDALNDTIDEYFSDIENREPDTKSTDPTYVANLKKNIRNFNSVLTYVKQHMDDIGLEFGRCQSLSTDVDRIIQGDLEDEVDDIANTIETKYDTLKRLFDEADSEIQTKIRTTESTYAVMAKEDGTTPQDNLICLGSISSRAFSFNYQINTVYKLGTKILIEYLHSLTEKFENAAANSVLSKINKDFNA